MSERYPGGLRQIGPRSYAYLQPPGSWGLSNCGLLVGDGQALLVDTLFTLDLTRRLLATIGAAVPGVPIRWVVNTHANGDHCWGNQLLPDATIVASAATAHGMADEIPPAAMTRMAVETPPDSPLGAYMREFFAEYDFGGIELTPAGRTFTGRTTVELPGRQVHLVEVGPAHTNGDVLVHVPDESVLYAGDILFIGDHPVMWTGPIGNWVAACETILATGAQTVVPGHGPVTNPTGVARFRDYLSYVDSYGTDAYTRGVPYQVAAAQMPLHAYPGWGNPERLVVTLGVLYRNLGDPAAADNTALIAGMADAYHASRTRVRAAAGGSARPG